MQWPNNGGKYMYRVIVIDEENDVVEINGSVKGLYIATTDEVGHLYSYVIGDAHSMTINKEDENE